MAKTLTKPFHLLTVDNEQTIHILNEHYQSIHKCKCPLPLTIDTVFPVFECDFVVTSQTDKQIWFWNAYRQQGTLLTLPESMNAFPLQNGFGITAVNDTQLAIINFQNTHLCVCDPFQQTFDQIELNYDSVLQIMNLIDGRLAITDLECIYIWDLAQKRCEHTLRMHQSISCGMRRLNGNQIATGHENGDVVIWTIIGTSFSYYRLHQFKSPIVSLLPWSTNQLVAFSEPTICKWDLRTCDYKKLHGGVLVGVHQVTNQGKSVMYCDNGRDADVRNFEIFYNHAHYHNSGSRILDQLPDERLVVSYGPNILLVNMKDKSQIGLVNTCLASYAYTRQDVEAFHDQLDKFLSPYLVPDLYDIIGQFLSEKLCNLL